MKRPFLLLVVLIVGVGPSAAQVTLPSSKSGSSINLSCIPSQVSGRIPFAVFFDATATTDASVTSRPFHDIEYSWSFGDAGAGTWSYGAGANTSKNAAYGPVTAHLFETAGAYTVTCTARDGTNTASQTMTITATDWPNDSTTICVSNTGSFSGCPSKARRASNTNSYNTAIANLSSRNNRLLFNRGDEWTCAGSCNEISIDGVYLGAYGSGAKPKVKATANSDSGLLRLGSTSRLVSSIRLVDLHLDGAIHTSTVALANKGQFRGLSQITLVRPTIRNFSAGFVLDGTYVGAPVDQVMIFEADVSTPNNMVGAYGGFIGAEKFAILGSSIAIAANNQSHVLRVIYGYKHTISNNTLAAGSSTIDCIKHHAGLFSVKHPRGPQISELGVFSDNICSGSTATFEPETGTFDERLRDIIIERNKFVLLGRQNIGLRIYADNVTVRNNLVDSNAVDGSNDISSVHFYMPGYVAPAPSGLRMYHNTCYSGATSVNNWRCLRIQGGSNVEFKNNLGYAPRYAKAIMFEDRGGIATASGNTCNTNSCTTRLKTSPAFAATPPVANADWKPTGASYAINPNHGCSGAACAASSGVPVWTDFFFVTQPALRDVGAAIH